MRKRAQLYTIAFISLIFFIVCVKIGIQHGPLISDEGYYWLVRNAWHEFALMPIRILALGNAHAFELLQQNVQGFMILNFTSKPLWFLFLIIASAFGTAWWSMCIPSALLAAIFVFQLASRNDDPVSGYFAAFLFVTSPLVLILASSALSNFAAGVFLIWLIRYAFRTKSRPLPFWIGFFSSSIVFVHYAVMPLVLFFLGVWFIEKKLWRVPKEICASFVGAMLSLAIVEGLTAAAASLLRYFHPTSNFTDYFHEFAYQLWANVDPGLLRDPFYYISILWHIESWPWLALLFIGAVFAVTHFRKMPPDIRCSFLVSCFGLAFFSLFSTQAARIFGFVLPSVYWFLFWAVSALWDADKQRTAVRSAVILLILLITAMRIPFIADIATFSNPQTSVLESIRRNESLASVPVVLSTAYFWPNFESVLRQPVSSDLRGPSNDAEKPGIWINEFPGTQSERDAFRAECVRKQGTFHIGSWSDLFRYTWFWDNTFGRESGQYLYCVFR